CHTPGKRRDPIGEGAILVRLAFHRERVLRDRQDPLFHHDEFVYERYRFSRRHNLFTRPSRAIYCKHHTPQASIDCLTDSMHNLLLFCEWYIFVVSANKALIITVYDSVISTP